MIDQETIELLRRAVEREAHERREAAGYDGAWDDGGANDLLETLSAWLDGIHGRVPKKLQPILAEAKKKADPEYREYVRLRKKFNG